ncbi:Hypothetical protein POVN_LOCUS609 [uncultured virus]|nr:Hypothetical protein POVN_LOCUS609 [uncultured virus]
MASVPIKLTWVPHIVYDEPHRLDNLIVVREPTSRQTFFGNLQSVGTRYPIDSYQIKVPGGKPFTLELTLLVPAPEREQLGNLVPETNVEVVLFNQENRAFAHLYQAEAGAWVLGYTAVDSERYLIGPTYKGVLTEGTYHVLVYKPGGGKYVLATGDIKNPKAPPVVSTKTLDRLQTEFFGRPLLKRAPNTEVTTAALVFCFILFLVLFLLLAAIYFGYWDAGKLPSHLAVLSSV